jgi:hypothetical protein
MGTALMDFQDRTTVLAWGLIGFGVILLFGIGNLIALMLFTLLLVLPGLALLAAHRHSASTAFLAVPGVVLAGTGLLLIVQSLTDFWESWAFAWMLYGTFIGYGLLLMGQQMEQTQLAQVGRILMIASTLAFAGFGLMFIVLSSGLLGLLIPGAMIAAGIYLLAKDYPLPMIGHRNPEKAKHTSQYHEATYDAPEREAA